jgi:hypothetical protein
MPKVIFTIQYDVIPVKRGEYLSSISELKSLIGAEGLDNYSVYEQKGKTNSFQEIFTFASEEAYENFDDAANERVNILISKIEQLKAHATTHYSTLVESV